MKKTMIALAVAACAAAPLPMTTSHAGELAGVTMPDSVQVGDAELVLNGLGLRKRAIFKVYVGGLYLPAKQSNAAAILAADEPRRLVMEFVRKVDADSIIGGWNDCLENNSPGASTEVRGGFEKLNGFMADVKKGDRLIFTYLPGSGVDVKVKGQDRGSISGKDFSDALFSCWIGEVPPSADFKTGLLGG